MALRMGIGLGLSRSAMLPALSLGFLGETLDPRITFSRGSNATLVDATGKITYAPANLLTWSEDFTNAAWVVNGSPVITANQVIAPDGTMTADTMAVSGASNGFGVYRNVVSSGTYVSSMYFKLMSGAFSLRVGLTSNFSVINCSTLAITNTGTGVGSVSAVGNGWYRFVSVGTISALSASEFYNIGSNTGTLAIWGAQLEPVTYQTTPSTYVATTASAYYGPRFDYDPVTLAPKGLLIEEARTNLLTYSEQFDNAAWIKSAVTITANATTSPDGTVDAEKMAENTTSVSQFLVRQTYASFVAGAYTFTFYAKAAERIWTYFEVGNTYANVNLSTGALGTTGQFSTGWTFGSASATAVGNGWYRCSITSTCTTPGSYFGGKIHTADANNSIAYAGTIGSGIFVWGAQLEAGASATSYIPTVASTVTRSADVATMTGTNFSSWYNQSEGTFVVNLTPTGLPVGASNTRYLEANDGTANNRKPLLFAAPAGTSAAQYRVAGADQAVLTSSAGAFAVGVNLRAATAYAVNDFGASYNGATALTDTSGSVSNTATQLTIGYATSGAGSEIYNGHIRQIAYYNTRLPNAQLQSLTA